MSKSKNKNLCVPPMWCTIPHLCIKVTTFVVYCNTYVVYYTTNENSPEIPILYILVISFIKICLYFFSCNIQRLNTRCSRQQPDHFLKKFGKKLNLNIELIIVSHLMSSVYLSCEHLSFASVWQCVD